jgi:multidrug efflux pump subunit AcrB
MAGEAAAPESFWLARSTRTIFFFAAMLTLASIYLAFQVPIAVFPETNFPRVVIGVDNGVMPVEQMQVTITRPIEDAVNSVPGLVTVRSITSRGSAEVSLFFNWNVDMVRQLQLVDAALAKVEQTLPATVRPTGSHLLRFRFWATASPPTRFRKPSCGRLQPTI